MRREATAEEADDDEEVKPRFAFSLSNKCIVTYNSLRDFFRSNSTKVIKRATPKQLDEYYVRKRMKTLFDLADTDGSGTISLNELYTLLESGACLFT